MNTREKQLQAIDRLLTIMDELREGCPWDRKQTMQTLRQLTIEETYELGDAILDNDLEEVKGELGDLLLHIVFYARIGSETGHFDIGDVAEAICEKLIRRHPHIYGDTEMADEADVKANWERIKLREGKKSVEGSSAMFVVCVVVGVCVIHDEQLPECTAAVLQCFRNLLASTCP